MFCKAAPQLRLTNTTVGSVSIAAGGSVAAPLLEAYNAGDGNLTLGILQISAAWITAAAGAAPAGKTTTLASTCFPIQDPTQCRGPRGIGGSLHRDHHFHGGQCDGRSADDRRSGASGGAVPSSVSAYVAPGST